MDLAHPLAVVTPTIDGDVLSVLARAEVDFTPGQVAKLVGQHSVEGVRRVLGRLTAQGIVLRRPAGAAYLYWLNREHLGAGPIIELADLRSALLARLGEHTATWVTPPVYGALFGSAARSDLHSGSDLDMFLVHDDHVDERIWSGYVDELANLAWRWTGNDPRPVTYSAAEVNRLGTDEPLLVNVAADGIAFAGDHQWLKRAIRRPHTGFVDGSPVRHW